MSFPVFERYNAAVVSVSGKFFGSTHGPGFTEKMDELIEEGKKNFVLDLSDATLMDSSGIGVLIATAERVRGMGGDLRLAGVQKKMRNLFLMTRLLGEVFTLYDTVDEAVDSYSKRADQS
jgi:anti-sigma B factor antagonist